MTWRITASCLALVLFAPTASAGPKPELDRPRQRHSSCPRTDRGTIGPRWRG